MCKAGKYVCKGGGLLRSLTKHVRPASIAYIQPWLSYYLLWSSSKAEVLREIAFVVCYRGIQNMYKPIVCGLFVDFLSENVCALYGSWREFSFCKFAVFAI